MVTATVDVIEQLNDEWKALGQLPVDWTAEPGLRSVRLADDAVALARRADDPDAVLLALLRLAQTGDEMAGRAVLQATLGLLIRCAREDRRLDPGELVSSLWLRAMSYPTRRRPRAVAANLVLDARKDARRDHRPLLARLPQAPRRTLTVGDVLERATELRLVDGRQRRVLDTVYRRGLTSAEAGRLLGMSGDLVRWHCSRTVRTLAVHRDALLAA